MDCGTAGSPPGVMVERNSETSSLRCPVRNADCRLAFVIRQTDAMPEDSCTAMARSIAASAGASSPGAMTV